MESSPTTARIEELLAHTDWVRALARNLSRDDADADDLAQETWLAALHGAPDRPGRAWLAGVTRNLSRMRWRSSARRTRREAQVAGEHTEHDAPAAPDEVVARMEMQRLLADSVLRLAEPWRSTVVQRYLDGLTSAEIARREGVPAATVRGRLKTALERLRVDLDERHEGRRDAWRIGLAPVLGISADEARALGASGGAGAGGSLLAASLAAVVVVAGTAAFLAGRFAASGSGPGPAPAAPSTPTPDAPAPSEPTMDPTAPAGTHAEDEDPQPPAPTPVVQLQPGTPAGMVEVPGGTAVIGTTEARLRDVLLGRVRQVQEDFAFEAPQHRVEMAPFFLDRYEVTNAQYLRFLQDTARVSYDTDAGPLADLEAVAGTLTGQPREDWDDDAVAWTQLYESNRDALQDAMPDVVVRDATGRVDEVATRARFRHAPLVPGMVLRFWSRKPPEAWPSMEPPAALLDHPVMSVSYDDAEAFAAWAGKHVPTEEEWEYAARGPEGRFFPWGNEWFPDLSHANWGAKNANADTGFKPRTMPVDSLPEGRSWCGAHHMLGNAGEWTSSWFQPYPGNEREHVNMGEYVKVIRGATFVDLELLVLRLAARNFIGQGVKAPPRPGNRFSYIGFRCAGYEQPGLDQLGPIVRQVSRGRLVTRERLALERYAGAVATDFAPADAEAPNHVTVLGPAQAVVVIPLRSIVPADHRTPRIGSRAALRKASTRSADPLPLAVLHTTLPLEGVLVWDGARRSPPGGGAGARPAVRPRVCPPGTYVLGVWLGRLCLCTESLEVVCALDDEDAPARRLDVRKVPPDGLQDATLRLDPEAGTISLDFQVRVGGRSNLETTTVVVEGLVLTPQAGTLAAAPWRVHSRTED